MGNVCNFPWSFPYKGLYGWVWRCCTCMSPSAKILMQIFSSSSVPKTSTRSSRLARTPLLTFLKIVVV